MIAVIDELYRAAVYLTGDRAEAQALLEAMASRLAGRPDADRDDPDLRVWLHTMLRTTWRERRSLKALRTLESMSPQQVQCALMKLPDEIRMTVYYADVEAMPYRQIAEIMNVDVCRVRSRLDEGRSRLCAVFDKVGRPKGKSSMTSPLGSGIITRLAEGTGLPALDVFGPQVEFLTMTEDESNQVCVMRGVIPPGVTVPLHRHDDFEDFFILSRGHQVLVEDGGKLEWRDAHAGDYIRIPGAVPHAHRNISDQPAVDLIITTPRMGQFFKEIGRPVPAPPPTPDDLTRFVEAAIRYGYRLGTQEENAAVGIELPTFTI